jgi:hypothetical protein
VQHSGFKARLGKVSKTLSQNKTKNGLGDKAQVLEHLSRMLKTLRSIFSQIIKI